MPVDPHTWVDDTDYLTATLLNGDMYRWNGEEFYPTGIRFHARKPIYASCDGTSTANSFAAGSWSPAYDASGGSQGTSLIRGDTGSLTGAWWDPNMTGNIRMSSLNAGGGLALTQGGVALMFGHVAWGPYSSGSVGAGLGLASGSTGTNTGTIQAANSARDAVAFVCDIVDGNSQRWTVFAYNGTSSATGPITTFEPDGSGRASRLHASWASVYPANGFTVNAQPNPAQSWSASSALSQSVLNGTTGFRNPLRYLNMPPLLRVQQGSTQSLTANVNTTVTLGSATYDTYTGLSGNTYTVPFGGVYLVHGYVGCQNFNGNLRAGVAVNGTTYWGPDSPMPGSGHGTATKTQLLSLSSGDTVTLQAKATAGATTSSVWTPRLIVYAICPKSIINPSALLPDTTFRWAAGTAGPVSALFNQHIANDLGFLLNQRPYALAYQTVVTTGIAMNTPTTVVMDTDTGLVHAGDNCDNWSAFNTSTGVYTAPRNGWYLAVWEIFLAAPSLTSTPVVIAVIKPNPSGLSAWDLYQEQNMVTSGAPGATGMGFYYLRAGDTIQPGVQTQDSSATTISTQVGTGINSSFGIIWMGE